MVACGYLFVCIGWWYYKEEKSEGGKKVIVGLILHMLFYI